MYNTELNLTSSVESGFDVDSGECVCVYPCLRARWKLICVCVCVRAWLSWSDLCVESRFNEAAETHTLYYSRAQHYSWPNSLSLLLWELLDSFPILWSCIVCGCACACQSLFMCAGWYSSVKLYCECVSFFFPWRENDWSRECVINPIFTLSSHLSPALTGLAYSEHYPI